MNALMRRYYVNALMTTLCELTNDDVQLSWIWGYRDCKRTFKWPCMQRLLSVTLKACLIDYELDMHVSSDLLVLCKSSLCIFTYKNQWRNWQKFTRDRVRKTNQIKISMLPLLAMAGWTAGPRMGWNLREPMGDHRPLPWE